MVKWEVVELGKYANIYRGGSPRPIQAYLTTRVDGINWIKIGDVAPNAKYINETEEKIIPDGVSRSRAVSKGDFILSNSMSFGRPYILNIAGCIHDGWLTIQNYKDSFDTDFLYYFLSSEITLRQYIAMAAGSSVQNLNKDKVSKVLVTKPPLTEQRAIAAALSDVDRYISALERLIDKKRNIKKGAMQELLTGKRRLPGFDGEWGEKTLNKVLEYTQPQPYIVSSSEYSSTGTPVLTAGKTFILGYTQEISGIFKNTPTILFDDFLTISRYIDFPFKVKSSAVKMLSLKQKEDNLRLIFEIMQTIDFKVSDHQRHWISKYGKLTIRLPEPKEQTAIAAVLSDMDSEIDALTAKLDKIRNIKQGMMQELLTGCIRLVTDEIESISTSTKKHNPQFDDAVMIAGIVDVVYSEKFPLGRKKLQKFLYLLRRHQNESTTAFKKKAAGPYADKVRYEGGEPIARNAKYIVTKTISGKGTTFARGANIGQALDYIKSWGREADIRWLVDNLKYKKVDELELLATVDMAICDLKEDGIAISLATIKNLIATNMEWKGKLDKEIFSDLNIARAIKELQMLF